MLNHIIIYGAIAGDVNDSRSFRQHRNLQLKQLTVVDVLHKYCESIKMFNPQRHAHSWYTEAHAPSTDVSAIIQLEYLWKHSVQFLLRPMRADQSEQALWEVGALKRQAPCRHPKSKYSLKAFKREILLLRTYVCKIVIFFHPQEKRENLQPHQVDMFFILEGMEKLWEPGTAVQSQDPPLFLMKNHLEKNWKGICIRTQ